MLISIVNQKVSVAKTTTDLKLAHHLDDEGYKVLEVDIDPQGSLHAWLQVCNRPCS